MDGCEVKGCHGSPDVTIQTICEPVTLCWHCASWLRDKFPQQRNARNTLTVLDDLKKV